MGGGGGVSFCRTERGDFHCFNNYGLNQNLQCIHLSDMYWCLPLKKCTMLPDDEKEFAEKQSCRS